jgi:hypothetical protein
MKRKTLFFGIFATTILTVPVFAAGDNAGITGVHWGRNAFGYEPLPSGPQPVTNWSAMAYCPTGPDFQR